MTSRDLRKACTPEVFRRGKAVFVSSTIDSVAMEGWVLLVRSRSGQQVDWHSCAGRAVVKAIGDIAAVRQAISELLPVHDMLYRWACEELEVGQFCSPHRPSGCWVEDDGSFTPQAEGSQS